MTDEKFKKKKTKECCEIILHGVSNTSENTKVLYVNLDLRPKA